MSDEQKKSWPELVGTDAESAAKIIRGENKDLKTQILPVGSRVTKDFRMNRVRIFVESDGNTVSKVPHIG